MSTNVERTDEAPDHGDPRCPYCGTNTGNPRRAIDQPCPNDEHPATCAGCCAGSLDACADCDDIAARRPAA